MHFLFVLMQAVLVITGAVSMEELDESVVEQFDHYRSHPLRINCVSDSKLLASGLLSEYQVASLREYRSRCGDVLSWTELAAVDGFGKRYADALKEYVSLESGRRLGAAVRDSALVSHSLCVRGTGRLPQDAFCGGADGSLAGGLKYSMEAGDVLEFSWSSRNTFSSPDLQAGNFGLGISGTTVLRRVILGDYGLRFGQGLLAWSGFSMSGVNSALALSRNGSGATVSHSYSRMHHGACAEFVLGKWTAVAALSFPDFKSAAVPLMNVKRSSGTWTVSATALKLSDEVGASVDFRKSFGPLSIFAEVARSGDFAAVLGMMLVPEYGWTASVQMRHYPCGYSAPLSSPFSSTGRKNDEQGVSAALQTPSLLLTLDASRRISTSRSRYRALVRWGNSYSLNGTASMEPSLRASFLYRPEEKLAFKEDIRLDCRYLSGGFWSAVRGNVLWCKDFAWMCYAEAGAGEKLSASGRVCIFRVDNWDDRIYCYERDAPGNFNSLALYGRGWNASAFIRWKMSRAHSLYLRAFGIFYPGTPGRTGYSELRLQYCLNLSHRSGCRFFSRR